MARHQQREQPVSDDEFEEMPDRISEHFEKVRDALDEALEDDE